MNPTSVFPALRRALSPFLAAQQLMAGPNRGAYTNPEWGLPDPSHIGTAALLAGSALLSETGSRQQRAFHRLRAELAADYMLCAQRPTGRIDFQSCNFDSAPDTAFVVQLLCAATEWLRASPSPETATLRQKLGLFVTRAAPGIAQGGFHTPNHRWVIASALAWSQALWPQVNVAQAIATFRTEGIDQDADGAYQERSIGVYDGVSNRSLWLLAQHAGWREATQAIRRNLKLDLALLHLDGSAETGLSRRQDRDRRIFPADLAAACLLAGEWDAGRWLWASAPAPSLPDCIWMCHALRHISAFGGSPGFVPPPINTVFPSLGLWRFRRKAFSISVFRDTPRLLHAVAGRAELKAVQISQCYFGVGRFAAETLQRMRGGIVLRSSGTRHPRRPGYDLPIGRAVPIEQWDHISAERPLRQIEPATSELVIKPTPRGVELRYRTLRGMAGVPAQLALDFAPGGHWQQRGGRVKPNAGDVLFLERGAGKMSYGRDWISVSAGASAHHMSAMRDTPTATDCVRVLLTFLTPVDHTVRLEFGTARPRSQRG